jgi:hypothetical protein
MGIIESIYEYCNDIMSVYANQDRQINVIYVPLQLASTLRKELALTQYQREGDIFGIPIIYWDGPLDVGMGERKDEGASK